jgi:two-component system phosphate regulon response regulator PhoB
MAVSQTGKREKVLVIELEPEMRIYLSNLLDTEGFDPIVCEVGTKELNGFKEANPCLIILDAMIPKAGSFHIYRSIKSDEQLKNVPIIMLSNIDRETFFQYLKVQCACPGQKAPEPEAYLEKPPEAENLLALVRRLTAKRV